MTPTRSVLLRDVADAIVASGYAVPPQSIRTHTRRQMQMRLLALDSRIDCSSHSAGRAALMDEVVKRYKVSRSNARVMIWRARKMRHEAESSRRPY